MGWGIYLEPALLWSLAQPCSEAQRLAVPSPGAQGAQRSLFLYTKVSSNSGTGRDEAAARQLPPSLGQEMLWGLTGNFPAH